MSEGKAATVRVVALSGPCGSGKTTLLEAMLHAAGAIPRKGSIGGGNTVGDATDEARARGFSTELNVASFDYLGDRYVVLDCPGSVDFCGESDTALPVADLVIVVAEADPEKAHLVQPALKTLDELGIPHIIFLNKIDKAAGRVREIIAAMQPFSAEPLVARQIPIWSATGAASGFIDLALERAYRYRSGQASDRIDLPQEDAGREAEARSYMLEQVADFDDRLMEDLINDQQPELDLVLADLTDEMRNGFIVPVFLGSAENGSGVRRLLKALRHEMPDLSAAAARAGARARSLHVIKSRHAGQAGRQTMVRVMSGELADGDMLTLHDGAQERIAGMFSPQGEAQTRIIRAAEGDVVYLGKLERAKRGDLLSADGEAMPEAAPVPRAPVYALAVESLNRADDVKLTAAMARLLDEDAGLSFGPDAQTREFRLSGQGDVHLRTALERLKRKFGVSVSARRPQTAYRETIRKSAIRRGRHKKQSGGHGQFGDVLIEVRPGQRGSGLIFDQKIHGGVVPKQYFGAIEAGVRDALEKGPLGFPVMDVEATLLDGSYHTVDSSEIAFRTAARIAVAEALAECNPVLLEPVHMVTIHTPTDALARITALIPMRRGQILGFDARPGWLGWDSVSAFMPEDEVHDLILEIRSATQGLGDMASSYAHMAEVMGKAAAKVVEAQAHMASAK